MTTTWRTPEEVLKLSASPTSVGVIDIVVFNDLKRAYEQLRIENAELRAILEIFEVKTLKEAARKKSLYLAEEQMKSEVEHHQQVINRLQNELHSTHNDLSIMTTKIEHKRKLLLGLQESLQANVDECLELRRSLEQSHLAQSQYQEAKTKEIQGLKESLSAATFRADVAEKKFIQSVSELDEARTTLRHRTLQFSASLLYVVTTSVYKRIVGRAMRQWRACTAAEVVRYVHVRQEEFVRERLREEHVSAQEKLRSDMQRRLSSTEKVLARAQHSREALLQHSFNSSCNQQRRMFGLWRNLCLRRAIIDRDESRATVAACLRQSAQTDLKLTQLTKTEFSLQRKCDAMKGAGILLGILHRTSLHYLSLRKAYHHWIQVLLIKRTKVAEFVENYNKLSDALERKERVSSAQIAAREKAERKLDAYRNITGSMADVSMCTCNEIAIMS